MKTAFATALFALALAAASARNPAGAPSPTPLGVNLEGLADWSRALMFTDAMKTARRFGAPDKPWEPTVPLDERGWPTQDAGSCIITDVPGIGGTYRLSFKGRADVKPRSEGVAVRNLAYDAGADLSTADVVVEPSATNLWLSWENTSGGVRNVRLLRPSPRGTASGRFNADFLRQLAGFQVLRFMDFTATNNNPVGTWAARTRLEDATYAGERGGPWECVADLANTTGRDVWINIPDQADDDYVRSLARYLHGALRFEINVYVEYSNEVWNGMFQQAQRNLAAARAEAARPGSRLTVPVSPDDDPKNETFWAWKRTAARLMEIAAIFREEWGTASMGSRIRPVLAGQFANPFMFQLQLDFIRRHFGPPADHLYGIAVAPYVYLPEDLQKKRGLTKDDVLGALAAGVDALNRGGYTACVTVARWNGLGMLAYEGGPDVGQAEENLAAKVAANRDDRMADILSRYIGGWWRSGGGLFTYYTLTSPFSRWGCWGLTDDVTAPKDPPKMRALRRLAGSPPPAVAVGTRVPGRITGATPAVERWAKVRDGGVEGSPVGSVGPDSHLDYLVVLTKPGRIRVDVRGPAREDARPMLALGGVALEAKRDDAGWTAATRRLEPGTYVLRLGASGGRVDVTDIALTRD